MNSRFDDAIRSPLSPAQRDFLLDSSTTPGASHHVLGTSIELGCDIDIARWQEAAHLVFRSEPGMRLRLITSEGETWQALDPDARLSTVVANLDAGSPDLSTWVLNQLAARPDIATDPSFVHAVVRDQSGAWHSVLMAPHIFIDGQGFRRFFEETSRAYEGESAEAVASVQPLFAAFERAGADVDLPETVEFWRRRLDGVAPLSFRTRTDPAGAYVDESLVLSLEESTAIDDCCGQRRLHPTDFFFAVYALVLERLREPEGPWTIHTIRSTRGPGERDMMGCFYRAMPTVLQPSDLALSAPVAGILAGQRQDRRDSRGRLRISMLALQELLPRSSARAFFNFYNFTDVHALGTVRQLRSHFFHRRDELHLVIARRAEGYELRAKFHTATFSDRRLLPRLAAVSAQVARGATTVADCEWLLPDERPAAAPTASANALAQAEESFGRHAVRSPAATALTLGTAHLSYADLEAGANRLARRLVAEGVGPGTLVGVFLTRSFEQVAAALAVLKAGGAFVPIDPDYPEERVSFILADSRVPLLIGCAPGGGDRASAGPRQLRFDDVRTDFSAESSEPLAARASLDDLAYVIYTSGSTGRPKGTLVTRRNLASLLAAAPPMFNFGPADTWTLLHSCAFDFSVWETFAPLASGGRLVVVPTAITRSPAELAGLIDREQVTVLNQTPSAFYHLAAASELIGSSLRYVIFGGEALEPRRLTGWFARFGDASPQLVNMYGITETTVHVTHRIVTAADAVSDASPIGRPLPGWEIYLVDAEGRPAPRGCSGEIWVGGAGVARGYLDRDDLTRDRFRDDPFRRGAGRRVYRSGDLARQREDGALEFLGRIDDQVKIRGYRIELGEVAAVLAEHPSVREAVVLAHPGPEGSFLVGYAIPAAGAVFDEAEVLRFLRRRLPVYMTCSRIVAVDGFTLTSHGKLDRGALPVPADRSPNAASFVAPRTATEELVATLFSEATGAAQVGANDDFFAVGGHSLAAMRVAARLQEVFRVSAGVGLLFDRPTVAQVAEYVDVHRGTAAVIDRPVFGREDGRDALPLTSAQERILLLQRLFPDNVAYNFEAMVRFSGGLDSELLSRALARIVERHEAFRTTFHDRDGSPVQRVHDQGVLSFQALDFSSSPPAEASRRVEDLRRATASQPFNPAVLPLIEWRLVKVAEREHLLLHREHHLIHDGWSFVVFLRDLLEIYRAMSEGRAPRLPACLAVGDYAAGHRRWLRGPAGAQQRQYWEHKLAGVPDRVDIPTDHSRPAVFSFVGDQLRFDLPEPLVSHLRVTARREGLTLYMLLLGAFSLVLSRLSGAEDLAIASGVANRRWEEVEHTIGMLVNNVVFRLRPRADVSVREYLREIRDEVLGGMANQDLPFGDIVTAAGVQRASSETPLAGIFFSSYEGPLPDFSLPGLEIEMTPGLALGSAKFDWNLVVIAQPARPGHAEQVTVLWEYSTDLFERSSVERARRQFLAAIADLIRDLDRPLRVVSISDEEEQRFLMASAEGSHAPYPESATVPELFARQAVQCAAAVAIRGGGETMTYAELDQVSDRVAAGLQARGVAMEEPVALLLPRSAGAIAVMLGILKAGAAYLPLSPKDPPARLARLVADAGARFIVTDKPGSATLAGGGAQLIPLNTVLTHTGRPLPVAGRSDAIAAIMFTSGSTGQPKGVEVLHRGMVRLLFGVDYAAFGPGETILQLAPLSFDASTLEIWGALLHGGTLAVFDDDLPSASALNRAITAHGVTTMWLNASLFNAIVDEDATVLAPVRRLLIGGEALSVAHVGRARRALPATTLVNGYGPTENTTFSCCYEIPRELDPAAASIPIGRPIAHSRARVLDAHLRLAPAGAVGEIYVGGDGLARGYRNRAQLTGEVFVPDPFAATPGARLYRTGDLGRVRPDGSLEFQGRRDGQVKVRGHRVEPGEIESALRRIAGVSNASVQCLDDAVKGRSLVAFVVADAARKVRPADVLQSLGRELPPYLLPSRVLVLPALPVTPHGKLDAAALIRTARSTVDVREAVFSVLPRTALEGVMTDIFAEVLGQSQVDPDQDFFAAGGHSVLVVRALAKMERALGIQLEPSVFLHSATPRQLAQAVEHRMKEGLARKLDGRDGSVIQVSAGTRPLFLVPGGEGGDISMGVYARLALQLPGRSFYALRLSSDDSRVDRRAMTVEAMAASCIADLRRAEPGAAVDLVGGCIGGIVAYEMARQLEAEGRAPERLILLDTPYPSRRQWLRHRMRGWSAWTRRHAIDWLVASNLRRSRQERIYQAISKLLPLPEHEASPHVPPEWYRFGNSILRYRLKPLRMPVVLLATDELVKTGTPRRWQKALGDRLSVRRLPGTHWTYIRSDIAESGAVLRAALE